MKYLQDYDELLGEQIFTILEQNFVAGIRPVDNQSESRPLDTMPSNNSIFPLLSSTEQEQLNDKKNCTILFLSIKNLLIKIDGKLCLMIAAAEANLLLINMFMTCRDTVTRCAK